MPDNGKCGSRGRGPGGSRQALSFFHRGRGEEGEGEHACRSYSAGKLEKLQSKGEGMTFCRLKVDDGRGDELPRNRRE